MNASKLSWVVFGLLVGAGAAWSFMSSDEQAKPAPVAVTPVEQAPKESPKNIRVPVKKTARVAEKVEAEPVALKVAAPDVGACGSHAVVATDVIAHVRAKGATRRVTVTATPESEPLSECVREQVTNAAMQPFDGVQTFRYSFAPR